LKFKPHNTYNTHQTNPGFIQASKLHSELLLHYSCYSDTRGVTVNTRNRNANAENNNAENNNAVNPPPPLTLEQVLVMQAQILQTIQQNLQAL
jgi:hypothetical protein